MWNETHAMLAPTVDREVGAAAAGTATALGIGDAKQQRAAAVTRMTVQPRAGLRRAEIETDGVPLRRASVAAWSSIVRRSMHY